MNFSHPQGSVSWICVLMSFSVLLSSTLISVPFSHFFSSGTPFLHRLIFFTVYHTSFPFFCVVITFVPKIQCRYFLLAIFQLTNTSSAALILLWNPFIKFSVWGIYFFHFWNLNFIHTHTHLGFLCGTSGKEPTCQCRRHKRCRFVPWVGKIPWRRAWKPTPVFLPGESHGQRSLTACSHRQ